MGKTLRLIVADDHTLFRRGLVGLLGQQPDFIIVGEVSNGPEAVQVALERRPDVVLMDVHMPAGSGISAVESLKQQSDVRVLMLTISDSGEDLLAALAAGADGYLLKNAEPEQLCRAIRQISAGHSALSPEVTRRVIATAVQTNRSQAAAVLTAREQQVLDRMAHGDTTAEVATALNISANTVKTHVRHIMDKLDAANRTEAVARATALGIIAP